MTNVAWVSYHLTNIINYSRHAAGELLFIFNYFLPGWLYCRR